MRNILLFALLLSLAISAPAQTNKPLKVTSLVYYFNANNGSGENGDISFVGSGFSGITTAGTSEAWTFLGYPLLPGDTLQPSTGFLANECCGYFDIGGTHYLWGYDCAISCVSTNMSVLVAESSFTFPATPPAAGDWTVQVPAKINPGVPITISYWAQGYPDWITSRLQVRPGKLMLTWSYVPPDPAYPGGAYFFVNGTFISSAKR